MSQTPEELDKIFANVCYEHLHCDVECLGRQSNDKAKKELLGWHNSEMVKMLENILHTGLNSKAPPSHLLAYMGGGSVTKDKTL